MPKSNEPLDAHLKERREPRAQFGPQRAIELRGKKISWVGIESNELMLRGCDQLTWLANLAAEGIRHVILSLNGSAEDTCLFARKHVPAPAAGHPRGEAAVYDLEHRDEGFFTRLKFLLEAAAGSGVLVGLSLFDGGSRVTAGPLASGRNVQGVVLEDRNTAGIDPSRLAAILETATGWVCSAVRGQPGIYIELFRNLQGEILELEGALTQRVADTLAKHGEDLSPDRPGPWVVQRGTSTENKFPQSAPFELGRVIRLEKPQKPQSKIAPEFSDLLNRASERSGFSASANLFKHAPRTVESLVRFEEGVLDSTRFHWMWSALFRGHWPVIPLRVADTSSANLMNEAAALARFSLTWVRGDALRPNVELLGSEYEATAFAAEDSVGRFYVYFIEPAAHGLRLSLPPGLFRNFWIDPASGKTLDRCDGISGGRRASVTGTNDPRARLLIIEPGESSEAVTSW